MQWLLVFRNEELGTAWHSCFAGQRSVEIIGADICNAACDAVVSPANSFGFMDGGLDLALVERFGPAVEDRVKAAIAARPLHELLVGEALIVPTDDPEIPWLVSAPTMRVPMRLGPSVNAYLAMKAILAATMAHEGNPPIHVVAIPGLATGVGGLPYAVAARQMWAAFSEVILNTYTHPVDYADAQRRHVYLHPEAMDLWNP